MYTNPSAMKLNIANHTKCSSIQEIILSSLAMK